MAFKDKVSAWLSLNETTGVRANLHTTGAAWDLAEVNSVGFQAGLQGNAADFNAADLEYLFCNDTTKYRNRLDWTICFAIHNARGSGVGLSELLGKSSSDSGQREWAANIQPSVDTLQFVIFHSAGLWNFLIDITGLLHSDADPGWDVIFLGRRSAPSHQLIARINDGAIQTFAAGSNVKTGTNTFKLAAYIPTAGSYFNGGMDELVWCDDTLTSAEMDEYYNGGALVSYADIFQQAPDAPTLLTATATAGTKIALGWVDNSDDETGFKVERSLTGAGGWSLIQATAANATSYTDTALTPGVKYFYRVAATNAEGDSAYTDIESATTLIGEPTLVLTETRPTLVLTETRPTCVLTETRPTLELTEL